LSDAEALGAIERALHGKLRAHRLSDAFIDRHREDAVQQGLAEYGRALARGGEIDNPGAWVVKRAYLRAIDELRREERFETGEEALAQGERRRREAFSPTEAEAVGNVEVGRLRAAIEKLSAEQRQALGLYYFEERSTREAAQVLGCGQSTFRRRLDSALGVLRQRFGIAMPEPGSELAIEVGLAAWLSLAGARVVPNGHLLDRLIAAGDSVRGAVASAFDRGRDATTRLLASGAGEGIGTAASGPLGKAAGGVCAGALAVCAFTGVVGPGVGGIGLVGSSHETQRPKTARQESSSPGPVPSLSIGSEAPAATGTSVPSRSASSPGKAHPSSTRQRERQQVRGQTDGFARAAGESTATASPAPSAASSTQGATEPSSAPPTSNSSSSSSSQEEAQAKQQFGAFK
jgi:RNA polymerase sigma-70 factor (ECF subfamily)